MKKKQEVEVRRALLAVVLDEVVDMHSCCSHSYSHTMIHHNNPLGPRLPHPHVLRHTPLWPPLLQGLDQRHRHRLHWALVVKDCCSVLFVLV